jgi:hypothetical protein
MDMWQVIVRGTEGVRRSPDSSTTTQPCPFCGADPPLAVRRAGRFLVGCEAKDCPANPQVSGATLQEAWAGWNRRA